MEVEHFIISELEDHGIDFWVQRDFIHVSCPFHDHSGTKKKLGFSRTSGGMHCWVCKKKGHWNEYAQKIGLRTFDTDSPALQDFAVLAREFDRIEKMNNREPEAPEYLIPWERASWRKLPADFLRSVPSYEWYDEASKGHRILWPIYINDKFKGCTSARLNRHDTSILPKTRNLGGMDAQKVLFPFDYPLVRESKSVVLVEGQADALRPLYHGIPTVSILGAGAWDPFKLTLLAARGVKRVVLAFDGDLAGERLTDAVTEQAESLFEVRQLHFPDPDDDELERDIKVIDPDNCKLKYLKLLKRMVRL